MDSILRGIDSLYAHAVRAALLRERARGRQPAMGEASGCGGAAFQLSAEANNAASQNVSLAECFNASKEKVDDEDGGVAHIGRG